MLGARDSTQDTNPSGGPGEYIGKYSNIHMYIYTYTYMCTHTCIYANIQGPAAVTLLWLVEYVNVSHEMESNLNISPTMSYGVLQCDSYVTELLAYGFVIKDFE